jgi:hypothetical protein
VCDVTEACNGSSKSCPADGVKSSGTVCRAAAGACDVAESCNGVAKACPANGYAASGTYCGDGTCSGSTAYFTDTCNANGSCVDGGSQNCSYGCAGGQCNVCQPGAYQSCTFYEPGPACPPVCIVSSEPTNLSTNVNGCDSTIESCLDETVDLTCWGYQECLPDGSVWGSCTNGC